MAKAQLFLERGYQHFGGKHCWNLLYNRKFKKANWIGGVLRRICLLNTLLKEEYKGREDEEEDVSNYWMTLRKREDNGNSKRKHQIALSGELALEEAMGLS